MTKQYKSKHAHLFRTIALLAQDRRLTSDNIGTLLGLDGLTIRGICRRRGIKLGRKQGRPRVANPVRERPSNSLAGQAHYNQAEAVQLDPFNLIKKR